MTVKYTKDHEWVRLDGAIATIGISAHAAILRCHAARRKMDWDGMDSGTLPLYPRREITPGIFASTTNQLRRKKSARADFYHSPALRAFAQIELQPFATPLLGARAAARSQNHFRIHNYRSAVAFHIPRRFAQEDAPFERLPE